MTLDPTAREANFRDSVKKFFVDNLYTTEGVAITFDKSLSSPKIQGQPHELDKWISINFGDIETEDPLASASIVIFICSRGDAEGNKLVRLRDKVIGYLVDPGIITLYRSYPIPWTVLGGMKVYLESESTQLEAEDGTKFKRIPITLKWGCKYE